MGTQRQGVDIREKSIRVTFTLDGKQHRPTLMAAGEPLAPTPANIKYAVRLAAEIREAIKHDTFSWAKYFPASGSGSTVVTLGEWLKTWLAAQLVTAATRKGYQGCVNFWVKELGEAKPLRAIKHSEILTALAKHPDLSGKTVNNRVSVLREAFDLAIADKVIADNPVHGVKRAKYQKPLPDPFTADEVEAILADMRKHYHEQVANYVEAKFFTGLRTGESFGLRWINVSLSTREIVVCEGVVEGEEVDRTKTDTARTVLLNSRALAAFKRQQKHTLIKGGHVFHDPRGVTRWSAEQTFRYFWGPTLKRLKMRYRPPYNTRHTYATMMLMAGMTPAFCARQMGHSVELFLNTYSKWIPGAGDQVEMDKLEARLAGNQTKAANE